MITSDRKLLSVLAVGAVIALFIHHAFHAAAIHRRSLNQHKENENRERSLRQRSQELIEEKTALIRLFSHEIRTPLNGIIGALELLAQNTTLDDNAATEVNICRRSAFDLHHIAATRLSAFSADGSTQGGSATVQTSETAYSRPNLDETIYGETASFVRKGERSTTPNALKNILIVDDNKTNRHIARRMLDTLNLPSLTCNDGTEAVELAGQESFSAFLMDIQMPVMDGISATKIIRQASLNKTTPVIAVSANCQDDMQSKFDAVGINAFLEKPYTRPQLKAMLGKFRIHERGEKPMTEQLHLDEVLDQAAAATAAKPPCNVGPEMMEEQIIDLEMLSDLEETLELDGTIEIITMCLEELGELCKDYDDLEDSHDEGEKRRIAHKIKGCASSACANALSSIAASIEDADPGTLQQSTFGAALTTAFQQTAHAFSERYDLPK